MRHTTLGTVLTAVTLLATFFLVVSALPGQAPPQGSSPVQPDFAGMELSRLFDLNRDGSISRDEWKGAFEERDKNKDGLLSLEELRFTFAKIDEDTLGTNYGRMTAFERLDGNLNDLIDPTEWPGKANDFRYMDSNRDGHISREEFLSPKSRWWNQKFENLDFDANGIIARSEWLDSKSSFDRLDRNKNGVLDRREFYNPR